MTREPIYAALFSKMNALTVAGGGSAFKTAARRFRMFSDVAPADQPALFMVVKNETARSTQPLNIIWTIKVDLVIYVNARIDSKSPVGPILNPILDAIEGSFNQNTNPISNRDTLGGLVKSCSIEGPIEIDESINGDQAIAVIPIEIEVL